MQQAVYGVAVTFSGFKIKIDDTFIAFWSFKYKHKSKWPWAAWHHRRKDRAGGGALRCQPPAGLAPLGTQREAAPVWLPTRRCHSLRHHPRRQRCTRSLWGTHFRPKSFFSFFGRTISVNEQGKSVRKTHRVTLSLKCCGSSPT